MFQRSKSHTLLVYVLPYFAILSPEKQQRLALLHHHVLDLGNKNGIVPPPLPPNADGTRGKPETPATSESHAWCVQIAPQPLPRHVREYVPDAHNTLKSPADPRGAH